ncbi:MAG: beta-ketoacyl-ACP reductase [Candidatus Staskawiczbacteria bacterium RIFCSPHIGHO2_01_FULL_41_41]|uniref:Beta-ketoacyl-ACP reductase n=1 Tax=Candidatus Staskawiczbacteria bacterium RIFCSPHIGHO2_01_FULL_41_41 TaxID=1802203 RepID=A0A1G2HSC1_9BACT|nr:MAG: beta-ketoacyl-ACP reductase [Candidatus Staskawiczbacteria bacterium RIFCSPHIGHO2_01_FULL_41_41]HLD80279.1 3-oxoacyl-ACP reductase family protein [Candidatus Nanoarchaeia archaeon]
MLQNKVVLITGASKGIGKAIAILFAQQGATVIINYLHSEDSLQQTLQEIKTICPTAIAIQADISKADQVQHLFSEVKKIFGRLDVLINNAGILKDNLILKTEEAEWEAILGTNLKGTFLCTKEAAKIMLLSGGKIINITSVMGLFGNPGQAAYSSSKAGIIGFTKTAAKELGPIGITVNAIAPGLTETEMISYLTIEQRERLLNQTILKRIGQPQEIARVALFLASDLASYVNGQVINVDGGMT